MKTPLTIIALCFLILAGKSVKHLWVRPVVYKDNKRIVVGGWYQKDTVLNGTYFEVKIQTRKPQN